MSLFGLSKARGPGARMMVIGPCQSTTKWRSAASFGERHRRRNHGRVPSVVSGEALARRATAPPPGHARVESRREGLLEVANVTLPRAIATEDEAGGERVCEPGEERVETLPVATRRPLHRIRRTDEETAFAKSATCIQRGLRADLPAASASTRAGAVVRSGFASSANST